MADVSNKTLMGLMAVALVLIMVSTIYSFNSLNQLNNSALTGRATDGDVSIDIDGTLGISVTSDLDLGDGYVNTSDSSAWVSSDNTTSNWIVTGSQYPGGQMLLENTGSTIISVDIAADKSAQQWLCGGATCVEATPMVYVTSFDDEAGACRDASGLSNQVFLNDATTGNSETVCGELLPTDATDAIEIDFNVTVPIDATSGSTTITMNFTATTVV